MKTVTYIGTSEYNMFNKNGEISYVLPVEFKDLTDVGICEQAFTIFNAPLEMLDDWQVKLSDKARQKMLTSMSVGDTVQITNEGRSVSYVCEIMGWRKL